MNGYLRGLDNVIGKLRKEVEQIESGGTQGLCDALLFVGSESQQKAPVEYGDLRGSLEIEIDDKLIAKGENNNPPGKNGERAVNPSVGLIRVAQPPPKGTEGRVSYNEKYAAVQHERVDFRHPLGGEAKYLEKVLTSQDDQKRILKLIAGGIINSMEE